MWRPPWLDGVSLCCPHTGLVSDILIHGMKARNRSIHGDMVVVELLPKSDWKGRTVALSENDSDDKTTGESPSEPMPTGEPAGKSHSYPFLLCSVYFASQQSRNFAIINIRYRLFSYIYQFLLSAGLFYSHRHPNLL